MVLLSVHVLTQLNCKVYLSIIESAIVIKCVVVVCGRWGLKVQDNFSPWGTIKFILILILNS